MMKRGNLTTWAIPFAKSAWNLEKGEGEKAKVVSRREESLCHRKETRKPTTAHFPSPHCFNIAEAGTSIGSDGM